RQDRHVSQGGCGRQSQGHQRDRGGDCDHGPEHGLKHAQDDRRCCQGEHDAHERRGEGCHFTTSFVSVMLSLATSPVILSVLETVFRTMVTISASISLMPLRLPTTPSLTDVPILP